MTHDAIQPRRRVSRQAYVLNWAVAALIRPVSWVASIGSPNAMHNIRRVFSLTKPLLSSLPKSTVITPFKAPNLKGEWVMAANARDSRKVILYFHGGGYFLVTHSSIVKSPHGCRKQLVVVCCRLIIA